MNTKLTLGEKLKDLRNRRDAKLILADISEATGVSISTLHRLEADDDIRVGYQDIAILAQFYDVSADYLFGLTDLEQYRSIEMDALKLSDEAIAVLKEGNLNNRLISELIAQADFPQLLSAMEIYVDRKILPQMNTLNALFRFTEETIKENANMAENDNMLIFLQQSFVNEDGYLRYRISERFNRMMKGLYEAHEKEKPSLEQPDMFSEVREYIETFKDEQQAESAAKAKAVILSRQLGLDTSKLTDEEWRVLMKTLESSPMANRRIRRRAGR